MTVGVLPEGYTRLEYLESTGTQWIDTCQNIKSNTWVIATLSFSEKYNYNFMFGGWSKFAFGINNINNTFSFGGEVYQSASVLVEIGKKFSIKMIPNDGLYIDGIKKITSTELNENNNSRIILFGSTDSTVSPENAYSWNGDGKGFGRGRIYLFSLYDRDNLVCGFIPALDPSNRPCMFDIVSQTPFYNQGSGEFLYGPYRGHLGNDVLSLTNKTINILSNRKEQLKTIAKEQNQILSESQNLINSFDNTKITYVNDNTEKYSKDVPSNSLKYAEIKKIGGKTVCWNQLVKPTNDNVVNGNGYLSFSDGTSNDVVKGIFKGKSLVMNQLVNYNVNTYMSCYPNGYVTSSKITNGYSYVRDTSDVVSNSFVCGYQISKRIPIGHVLYVSVKILTDFASTLAIWGRYHINSSGSETSWFTHNVTENFIANISRKLEYIVNVPTAYAPYNDNFYFGANTLCSDVNRTISFTDLEIIDLTQMFGFGNEPSTVDELNQYIDTSSYIPYSDSNIKGTFTSNLSSWKLLGENLIDNALYNSKTYCGVTFVKNSDGSLNVTGTATANTVYDMGVSRLVLPKGTYYFNNISSGTIINQYGVDVTNNNGMNYIFYDGESSGTYFKIITSGFYTFTSTAFIRYYVYLPCFSSSGHTFNCVINPMICRVQNTNKIPEYKSTYLGGNVNLSSLNLRSVGDICDTFDSQTGTITRRVGIVDLGTLTWNVYGSNAPHLMCGDGINTLVKETSDGTIANLMVSNGKYKPNMPVSWSTNLSIMITRTRVWIEDESFSDASSFKSAMSGVYLLYELATPTTETVSIQKLKTQKGFNQLIQTSGTIKNTPVEITYKGTSYSIPTVSSHKYFTRSATSSDAVTSNITTYSVTDPSKQKLIDMTRLGSSFNTTNDVYSLIEGKNTMSTNTGTLISGNVQKVRSIGRNLVKPAYPDATGTGWHSTGWYNGTVSCDAGGAYKFVATPGWQAFRYYLGKENTGKTYSIRFKAKLVSSETTAAERWSIKCANSAEPAFEAGCSTLLTNPQSNMWYDCSVDSVQLNSSGYLGITIYCNPEGQGLKTTYLIKDFQINEGSLKDYEPYHETNYEIPSAVRSLDGYGLSAGDIKNEIDFIRKLYLHNVSNVDLGALNFYNQNELSWVVSFTNALGMGNNNISNITAEKYTSGTNGDGISSLGYIGIGNDTFSDIARSTFIVVCNGDSTTRPSGMMNYELYDKIITDLSAILPDNLIEVESGGTLIFESSGDSNFRIPIPSEVTYITKS